MIRYLAVLLLATLSLVAQTTRTVGIVSHNYHPDGKYVEMGQPAMLAAIKQLDAEKCDTVVFSHYTVATTMEALQEKQYFGDTQSIKTLLFEVVSDWTDQTQLPKGTSHLVVWEKGKKPSSFKQMFAQGSAKPVVKLALMADMPNRFFSNDVLISCGESNIITLRRKGGFDDPFGMFKVLAAHPGTQVIFNPVHDYMRRYEMRKKREEFSKHVPLVISVWNKGKAKGEAIIPWNVYKNGVEETKLVRNLKPTVVNQFVGVYSTTLK